MDNSTEADKLAQRRSDEATGLIAGSGVCLLGLLALIWAFAGWPIAALAAMACFATLALLVGVDRLFS